MGSDDLMGQRCPPRSSIEDDTVKLLYCASRGDAKELKRFLEEGVSVNVADYDGRTALHLAASEGHMNCVNLLLQYNANINPRDRWGYTPLSDAKRFNHTEVASILEAKGGIEFDSLPPEYEIDITELEGLDSTPIGSGAFGEVRVVKWRGTRVAAKTILNSLASDQQVRKEFIRELRILQKLHHPNIVQFLGAVTKGSQLVIVTEFLPRGDLDTLINKRGKIDTRQAIRFALDIARGMNYLHEYKPEPIVHRDLKPRNILLDEAGHLKVADFGLSRLLKVPAGGAYAMTGETGSYRYMAPEVYEHKPYDKSVDVFSFGIITYEIFAGGLSNKYQMPRQVIEDRVHNIRPSFSGTSWHPKLKQLLQECWDKDPLRRPKFADIIKRLEDVEKERSVKCFFSALANCC